MRASHTKLGRNDLCPCGSGNKYKRCCLSSEQFFLSKGPAIDNLIRQKSEERLKNRVTKNMHGKCTLLEGELPIKMSEVIIDLASDLLDIAKTKSQYKAAICVTCLAWNIAVLKATQRKEPLEALLLEMRELLQKQDVSDIVDSIVEQKNVNYPGINRIILDFELVGSKGDFHLNIVSTVPEEALAEPN